MQIDLSQRQQQTVGTAITIVAALVIVCAIGGLLWLLGAFVARFSSVFLPLAVAGVAALVLHPYYALLRERVRLPVPLAVLGVLISMLLPIALFSWFFGALVVNQLSDLVAHLPEWWKKLVPFVKERLPSVQAFIERHQIAERLREAIEGKEAALVEGLQAFGGRALVAGAGVIRGIGTLFAWAVTPVYFVFFLAAEPRKFRELGHMLPFLKPESRRDVLYLLGEFLDIIVAFFRGQLIIALLQGLLFAAGFSIVGLSYGLVIGLALGLLNIIPYLGSIIGLSVALPIAFFQDGGGLSTLALVVLVFVTVQLIEGYLLTPKIMGERTGLHPLAIIIAVFFWGSALGGISGLVLAIPLTAFLVVFWRLARERYIGELV
jgi:predicted PurR-regulated permease PerM